MFFLSSVLPLISKGPALTTIYHKCVIIQKIHQIMRLNLVVLHECTEVKKLMDQFFKNISKRMNIRLLVTSDT